MFCPKCREEFLPGFDNGNDCGVPLVAELPALPAGESIWDIDDVTLLESDNMVMIALARKSLEHARIDPELQSANTQGMWGTHEAHLGSYGGGQVRIKVLKRDASAAVALMWTQRVWRRCITGQARSGR